MGDADTALLGGIIVREVELGEDASGIDQGAGKRVPESHPVLG